MTLTKKDLKLIIPFLLFVAIGISGLYSVDFITGKQTLPAAFKWFGLPTLIIAIYYAYHSTFGSDKRNSILRSIFTLIVMTFIIAMITCVSFQGFITLVNCKVGQQKDYLLTGQIVKLNYPKNKKIGNKYAIEILRKLERDIIKLDVPTNEYLQGQVFTKQMKIGSLGFIYATNN